jgi:hypothetical protein
LRLGNAVAASKGDAMKMLRFAVAAWSLGWGCADAVPLPAASAASAAVVPEAATASAVATSMPVDDLVGASPAAQARARGVPGRKLLTLEQLQDTATFPGELRPAESLTPLLTIPLGGKAPGIPSARVPSPPAIQPAGDAR